MTYSIFFHLRFLWFCLFKRNVVAAIDASGSMPPGHLYEIDRLLYVARKLLRVSFTVAVFDTDVRCFQPYDPDTGLCFVDDVRTGGGTWLDPVFELAEDNVYSHDALVVFTDGFVPAPQASTQLKILWVIAPDGAQLDKSYPGKVLYS